MLLAAVFFIMLAVATYAILTEAISQWLNDKYVLAALYILLWIVLTYAVTAIISTGFTYGI